MFVGNNIRVIPTVDKEMPPTQVRFKGFCESSIIVKLLDPGSCVVYLETKIFPGLTTLVVCYNKPTSDIISCLVAFSSS